MKDALRRWLARRPGTAEIVWFVSAVLGFYLVVGVISAWLFITGHRLAGILILLIVTVAYFAIAITLAVLGLRWNIDPRGGYLDNGSANQVDRRERATRTRREPADFKRLRVRAVMMLAGGVLSAVGMAIAFAAEPDNPVLPLWLMVGPPLLLILAAGYAWWFAGRMERLLSLPKHDDPNPDQSR